MPTDREIDTMADACIEAGQRVMRSGSPPLQAAMRVVLYVLGQELARRSAAATARRPPSAGNGSVDG